MLKPLLIVTILVAPMAPVAASGQSDDGYVAPELSRPMPGQLLNQETVAHPGASQSSGETPLDRSIRQRNDRVGNSICQGC